MEPEAKPVLNEPFECRPSDPKRRWITVEPVILLYFIYFSPSLLLAEQYIFSVISKEYNYTDQGNLSMCSNDSESLSLIHLQQKVQSESSKILLVLGAVGRLLSVFSTLLLGAYSDFGGRKIAMIVPLVGTIVKCLLFALVIGLKLHYWYLLIGVILEGALGSIGGILTGCFAYISDVTSTKTRMVRITILEVCIGVASAISQFASGYLIDAIGYLYTFLILVVITLVNILYVLFMVKETRRRMDPSVRLFSFKRLKECTDLYMKDNGTNRRWKLQLAIWTMVVVGMVTISKTDTQTYFLKGAPMCFNAVNIGFFSGAISLVSNMGSLVGASLFGRFLGDKGLMILGCISGMASMIMFTFVVNIWMIVVGKIQLIPSLFHLRKTMYFLDLIKKYSVLFCSVNFKYSQNLCTC